MNDSFCPRAWKSIVISPSGHARICCKIGENIQKDGVSMNVYEHSYAEIWNSDYMNNIRKLMLDDKKPYQCDYCYLSESMGRISLRQNINASQNSSLIVEEFPTEIELDIGNFCNLKCRMCAPTSSSSVANDKVHSSWRPMPDWYNTLSPHWTLNKELIFGQILSQSDKISYLQFAGGEPMLSSTVFDIIKFLSDNGNSKRIGLNITTNGTVFNKELLNYLSSFKWVNFGVSIEGIGVINDYIRYPSRWHIIDDNIKLIKSIENSKVYLATAIQAYNLIYIIDILRYADANNIHALFEIVHGLDCLNPGILPTEIIQETKEILFDYPNMDYKDEINYIFKAIDEKLENKKEMFKKFMLFTNDLDKSRKQDFKESLSELYGKLVKCGIQWTNETKYA